MNIRDSIIDKFGFPLISPAEWESQAAKGERDIMLEDITMSNAISNEEFDAILQNPQTYSASLPNSNKPTQQQIEAFTSSAEKSNKSIEDFVAHRNSALERFQDKKGRGATLFHFEKKIQYTCRKNFADNRPRASGRFVSTK